MQPILAHAKVIRSKRVKVHRELAQVLEEELKRRGAACVTPEEMFSKWKGLRETVNDQEIIWTPMVIIQNNLLDQDENEQVCVVSFIFICSKYFYMELTHLECHRNLMLSCLWLLVKEMWRWFYNFSIYCKNFGTCSYTCNSS